MREVNGFNYFYAKKKSTHKIKKDLTKMRESKYIHLLSGQERGNRRCASQERDEGQMDPLLRPCMNHAQMKIVLQKYTKVAIFLPSFFVYIINECICTKYISFASHVCVCVVVKKEEGERGIHTFQEKADWGTTYYP